MKRFISIIVWQGWSVGSAMVGYKIHHSIFWSICDYIFCVLCWVKWLILHQVNMSIIRDTFSFFFN